MFDRMARKGFIRLLAICLCILQNIMLYATPGGTFVLVDRGNIADISPYETAILQADLESYRYQNTRCLIAFDNGVQFELLSATELAASGQDIIVSNYKTTDDPYYTMPIFHLNENGTLAAAYSKPSAKQKILLNTN